MYLTATSLGRPRALHDHEQLELLLESFTKQVEEIVSEIDNTVANIQSTQEIAELMLDSGRNALLALDIKISFATLGAGCAAVVAGVFGMNVSPYFHVTATHAVIPLLDANLETDVKVVKHLGIVPLRIPHHHRLCLHTRPLYLHIRPPTPPPRPPSRPL